MTLPKAWTRSTGSICQARATLSASQRQRFVLGARFVFDLRGCVSQSRVRIALTMGR